MNVDEYFKLYLEKESKQNFLYKILEYDDNIIELILSEKKKARSSSLLSYKNKEDIPCEGDLSIVVNSKYEPICIIKNNKVRIILFKNLTYDLIKKEGEDTNLISWQKRYIEIFKNDLEKIDKDFEYDMPVVFEEYEIVYK